MRRILFLSFALVVSNTAVVADQWRLSGSESTAAAGYIDAIQVNNVGGKLKIFRRNDSHAVLEFKIGPRFSGLSRLGCPTFQITPETIFHHFDVGQACYLESSSATYDLGPIHDGIQPPRTVHALMNGEKVIFRYLAQDGMYHEMDFSLTLSKQILSRALGIDTQSTSN